MGAKVHTMTANGTYSNSMHSRRSTTKDRVEQLAGTAQQRDGPSLAGRWDIPEHQL